MTRQLREIGATLAAALVASLALGACFSSSPAPTTSTTTTVVTLPPTTSTTTTTLAPTTHVITPSAADVTSLLVAFKAHRVAQGAMLASEHIVVCTSCGAKAVYEAYDAPQAREYALLYAQFTGKVSYNSQVAAQDGGLVGLFWRSANGPWVVWTWNLPATCASEFPAAVSALWGLQQLGVCKSSYPIPTH